MTDVRDRIAAVLIASISEGLDERGGYWHQHSAPISEMLDIDGTVDVALMADAVIAELGLKRVEMGEWDVLAQGFRGYRYVTPWDVDDE